MRFNVKPIVRQVQNGGDSKDLLTDIRVDNNRFIYKRKDS